jgi:Family of unknown function (DUF6776)
MPRPKANQKLVLVQHRPGYGRRLTLYITFCILVVAIAAYYAGAFSMRLSHDQAIERLASLSNEYSTQVSVNDDLRQQVANLERSQAINTRAKNEIQTTISALKSEISQLQTDVSFYKGIMAPSDNNKGLQVQIVQLSATSENKRYAYKIVLAQVASNRKYVSGVVAVNLIGTREGEQEILPLRDVSEVKELGMNFKFRYFQDFEGELILPEGFVPQQLQIVAQSKGKNASRVEKSVDWTAAFSAE